MKPIDGDAAVWMLREHDMYEAAELIKAMPELQSRKHSQVLQTISDFLTSGAATLEIDASGYIRPESCYQVYRECLRRKHITSCYAYMDHKRVFLARMPGRGVDGKTAVRRT